MKDKRRPPNLNIKNSDNSNTLIFLVVLFVVAITLIPCFSITINNAVENYKKDFRACTLYIDPYESELTEEVLKELSETNHVKSVRPIDYMINQQFEIIDIGDENDTNYELQERLKAKDNYIDTWSLIEGERREVIAGKTLEESEVFSCIIPSVFYPFDDIDEVESIDYFDGISFIGKTLTIKASPKITQVNTENDLEKVATATDAISCYTTWYNYYHYNEDEEKTEILSDYVNLPALEYKLKVVGVYDIKPLTFGYSDTVYISKETGKLIEQMALEAGGIDLSNPSTSDVSKWWNTPSLQNHHVIVDNYDNIPYVYNKASEIGIDCTSEPELGVDESILIISNILNTAGIFFIIALFILCIATLIYISIVYTRDEKDIIAELKAQGCTNKQLFIAFYTELLHITLKGFLIGGVLTAGFVFISNIVNGHGDYSKRIFLLSWGNFFIFLMLTLLISALMPLISQLAVLHKLQKLQPNKDVNME